MLNSRGYYSRAALISFDMYVGAAAIQRRRLFEGGVFSRKYGTCFFSYIKCSFINGGLFTSGSRHSSSGAIAKRYPEQLTASVFLGVGRRVWLMGASILAPPPSYHTLKNNCLFFAFSASD